MAPQGRYAMEVAQWLPKGRRGGRVAGGPLGPGLGFVPVGDFPNPGLATCQDSGLRRISGVERNLESSSWSCGDCVG